MKYYKNLRDLEEPAKEFCGPNYITADRFFLVAMPLSFLVFNIVYWLSYGSQFIWSGEGGPQVWGAQAGIVENILMPYYHERKPFTNLVVLKCGNIKKTIYFRICESWWFIKVCNVKDGLIYSTFITIIYKYHIFCIKQENI